MTLWPKCEWCSTVVGVFRCRFCWSYTCSECVTIHMQIYPFDDTITEFFCKHAKYEPIKGDNWNFDDTHWDYTPEPEGLEDANKPSH